MGKSDQQRLGFAESIEPRFLKRGLEDEFPLRSGDI